MHNTGYSYVHAHIAHINNAREHCVHVTDHSGWQFSTTRVMKYLHCNHCMYTCGFRINAKLVKEGSFSHKCEIGKGRVKRQNLTSIESDVPALEKSKIFIMAVCL